MPLKRNELLRIITTPSKESDLKCKVNNLHSSVRFGCNLSVEKNNLSGDFCVYGEASLLSNSTKYYEISIDDWESPDAVQYNGLTIDNLHKFLEGLRSLGLTTLSDQLKADYEVCTNDICKFSNVIDLSNYFPDCINIDSLPPNEKMLRKLESLDISTMRFPCNPYSYFDDNVTEAELLEGIKDLKDSLK